MERFRPSDAQASPSAVSVTSQCRVTPPAVPDTVHCEVRGTKVELFRVNRIELAVPPDATFAAPATPPVLLWVHVAG